jgi:hypothetical protein
MKKILSALLLALGLLAGTVGLGIAPFAHADVWTCDTNPYISTTNCYGNGGGYYQRSTECDPYGNCVTSDFGYGN